MQKTAKLSSSLRWRSSILPFSALLMLLPSMQSLSAQGQVASNATATADLSFPDTKDGLQQFLLLSLQDAKVHDQRFDADIRRTEIPNYAKWFPATWPGPGPSWVEPYGKELSENEAQFGRLLTYLSRQDGQVVIRKVNDDPQGGKVMEWGMLQSMAMPVDVFYASWKTEPGPPDDRRDWPIGYFFYVDGGFRWDSTIHFGARLVHRVDPIYPYDNDGKHTSGPVMFRFKITCDGSVESETIQPVVMAGTVADAKLIKAASDALKQYRYAPPCLYFESGEAVSYARIMVAPSHSE